MAPICAAVKLQTFYFILNFRRCFIKGIREIANMNSKRANIFRFQYPERPTLFFAICYLAVSLVCLIGLISPEAIVCSSEIRNSEGLIEHGTGLIQGATARPCTILFMIFFYFSSKFFASCEIRTLVVALIDSLNPYY